jgi:single-stranded-DNA-specific exonuclease
MIGENSLLPAQAATLDLLAQGRSSLCVMATGRGKSLIFHLHAARTALLAGRASIFVYPLRALVADQSFHLAESFGEIGLSVSVLTGETPSDERDEVFAALADGSADIILTTPEFLAIHRDRFAESGRVGFIVIDEAHHAGLSKSGNRSAYGSLPEVRAALGEPTILAVTATAADEVASEICRLSGIARDAVVVDRSVRDNLRIVDLRNTKDRESHLVETVAGGGKCVVYVNSREQSVSLARMLRRKIGAIGQSIAFYNAGLTRDERTRVERAFRSGELSCIVSTSAFGEGVNVPDIAHVVLYHMPFGSIEFNQMSGRAGRNGAEAEVHLLFGSHDTKINERIVEGSAPSRDDLSALYRALRTLAKRSSAEGEEGFSETNVAIADLARSIDQRCRLDEHAVSCGIAIFRELGFLTTSGFSSARRIEMVESPMRMDLNSSIRYLEGLKAREEFDAFSAWALSAPADEMLRRINRPITPSFGTVV